MTRNGLIVIFLLFSFTRLSAQSPTGSCVKSTEGKEFWFGFMENRNYQVPQAPFYLPVVHYTEVTLVSENLCSVDIFIGKSLTPSYSQTVYPNIPLQVRIPWQDVEAIGSETIQDKAIHLVSDNPLNLYALNWCENSSDVAVIFPKESIGNEYYTMCYTPHLDFYYDILGEEKYRSGRNSEFLIVATEDNTNIIVTPSKITDKLNLANIPFTIHLSKGEIYQVQSLNHPNLVGQGDLTGSHIISDKPISVFSGALATTVPADLEVSAWDHLYEQMPPLQSWGRKFITVPLKGRSEDVFRVLASQSNTLVKVGNFNPVTLNKGDYYEFVLRENEPTLVESDRPVLLAQYMISNSVDRPPGYSQYTWDGDPFMVIVSPVDQTRESVTFVAYDSQNIKDKYYVNIVAKDDAVNQILLDNETISFFTLAGSGYSIAQVKISKEKHHLASNEPGKGFVAYVYGYGSVESYGYGVGFNLDVKLDLGGDLNFVKDTIVLCKGETKILDAGSHFSSFQWNTGETTQTKTVSQKGYYEVSATTAEGCELKDGIHVIESNENIRFGKDTTFCNPGAHFLDAGDFASFSWSTKDTIRVIPVKLPGLYSVTVIDKFGCASNDSILVGFSDRPKLLEHQIDSMICGTRTATVNISADKGSYRLTSGNPDVVIQNLSATVPDFGLYPFTFTATDEYSCATDTSFTIKFRNSSPAALQLDSACFRYSLDARYIGDAVRSQTMFTWILAGDTLAHGMDQDQLHRQLGSDIIKDELSLLVTEAGCQTRKVSQMIEAIPDLNFTISDSVFCEHEEVRLIAFHAANVVDYQWDWGDGVFEHLTDNAAHKYPMAGNYEVKLTARTENNCTNTISSPNLLHIVPIPTVGFSLAETQCLEPGTNSLRYVGSADATDRFNWDLSSLLEGELLQDPENSNGPLQFDLKFQPSARISLQVISKFGCASENRSILLKRKPVSILEESEKEGCAPLTVKFKVTSEDAIDQVDYHWGFGDGSSEDGDQPQHTYNHSNQQYDLNLIATSATTGCKDTILKPGLIKVYPAPEASFSMDQQVFLSENPTVHFLNQSIGATQYSWDFGDGNSSREQDPSHQYLLTGQRAVLLEAINEFGCVDTATAQVAIALSRIYPPTAFSPKAIYPVDREFKLFAKGIVEEGYHLKILSRWNDVVFECKNEIKGWDGLLSNGVMAQPGNYIWILDFIDFLGKRHRQTGTVMLVY